ncbi:hypothetical protein NTHI1209_00979 [Haemophilus influenzae]|uniref:Uncharacterized protein n=1 Tax=Haemophilus influenzae TaxID=727 RepID=A0A158SWX9_HAEIF|nr:hypothetical protein NTHI1209_00979 [Haemophilus influenzae]
MACSNYMKFFVQSHEVRRNNKITRCNYAIENIFGKFGIK